MTVTVVDDHTNLDDMDASTNNAADGTVLGTVGQTDTIITVQGSASVKYQSKAIGVGSAGVFTAANNFDLRDTHLYGWLQSLDFFNTGANGYRFRIANENLSTDTNFGEWSLGGRDTRRVLIEGFIAFCVNTQRPWDFTTGTLPTRPLTTLDAVGLGGDMISASGQNTFFVDQLKTGGLITVTAGTTTNPGVSSEIASADDTDGRGSFKDIRGTFYILTGITLGDITASTDSFFRDTGEVWVFEDQPVSGAFYIITCVGGTGTNEVAFGSSTGTGTAKEGSGGNSFISAGGAPFHVHALESDVDVGFFGCNMTGPTSLLDDTVMRALQENNTVFVDISEDINDSLTTGGNPFPTSPDTNDRFYLGHNLPFYSASINVGTAGTGTYTVTWEYWNGSSWASLTDVADGTNAFKNTGTNTVTFSRPDDWATNTVDSFTAYWIRAERDGGTETARPAITQAFLRMAGDVRLEVSSVETIRTTFTQMGSIRVRNGAFLKKSIITDSIAGGKHAALDLGSADPAADTVRDLTIQNCKKGVLLKGTGNVTYTFRNITFSGNNTIFGATQEDASPAGFVDQTVDANDVGADDVEFFPVSPANNDAFYIGEEDAIFDDVRINVGQAGAGTYTVTWQYWNGSSWTALSGVSPSGFAFKSSGVTTLTFTRPTDWQQTAVDGKTAFWIRALRDGGTETTRPLGTQIEIPGDVRVDFGGGDTVTINIVEAGDTPLIDNVNGSTVTVNNNVTATITVKDEAGVAIVGAEVSVRKDSDNSEILGGTTNGSGIVAGSVAASEGAVNVRVRKGSGGGTDYIPVRSAQTVGAGDFSVTITMIEDVINSN